MTELATECKDTMGKLLAVGMRFERKEIVKELQKIEDWAMLNALIDKLKGTISE